MPRTKKQSAEAAVSEIRRRTRRTPRAVVALKSRSVGLNHGQGGISVSAQAPRVSTNALMKTEAGAESASAAGIGYILLSRPVVDRASLPMPTAVKTLDAIHLTNALLFQERRREKCVFATHDTGQAMGIEALGFEVIGA